MRSRFSGDKAVVRATLVRLLKAELDAKQADNRADYKQNPEPIAVIAGLCPAIHDEFQRALVGVMDYRGSSTPWLAFRSPGATAR